VKTLTEHQADTPIASPAKESGATAAQSAAKGGNWAGAAEAYTQAFTQIRNNPQPLLIMVAVYVVLSSIATVLSGYQPYFSNESSYAYLPELTWVIFLVPLARYALAVADKRLVTMSELFTFTTRTFFYLLVAVIIVSLITGLSALFLLIPLIWTVAWFAFTEFPVAEQEMTPANAMDESKRLAQHHKAKVWGIVGFGLLLVIPALILTFIPFVGVAGMAAFQVLFTCTLAILYRWLQAQQPVSDKV
jgi:hypothetical protein